MRTPNRSPCARTHAHETCVRSAVRHLRRRHAAVSVHRRRREPGLREHGGLDLPGPGPRSHWQLRQADRVGPRGRHDRRVRRNTPGATCLFPSAGRGSCARRCSRAPMDAPSPRLRDCRQRSRGCVRTPAAGRAQPVRGRRVRARAPNEACRAWHRANITTRVGVGRPRPSRLGALADRTKRGRVARIA